MERQLNLGDITPVSNTGLVTPRSGWNATSNGFDSSFYFVKLKKDGFANRYVISNAEILFNSSGGSSTLVTTGFTTDFVNWRGLRDNQINSTLYFQDAFNNYTGTKVQTYYSGSFNPNIYRYIASNAYTYNATASNTYNVTSALGSGHTVATGFLDTGNSGTSRLHATALAGSSLYFFYSTDDGVSWSYSYMGNSGGNLPGAIKGSPAEIMTYASNQGIFRSTDLGNNWSKYNFGDNVSGTSSGYFPRSLAWNNSTWLAVNSNSDRLCTKAMGSGTSWTRLTNAPHNNVVLAVGYNPTLSVWIMLDEKCDVFYNTNSDPNAGSWVFAFSIGGQFTNGNKMGIAVVAAGTFNFHS
jgi:hypothetical protein